VGAIDRQVPWPGCVNFRDAGGYETLRGAVPWGRIYRSGQLSGVDASTAQRIEAELGLRTVIDLRTSMERRVLGPGGLGGITRWDMPLFESIRSGWAFPMDRSSRAGAERYFEMLTDGAATVALLVRKLTNPEVYPVLIHCAAGRDRTGIVIALLHSLLGVAEDDIAADYALSANVFTDDELTAHPETMRLLLQLIDRAHGSVRGFFLAQGVTESDLALLESAIRTP